MFCTLSNNDTVIEPASLLQAEKVINKHSGLTYDQAVPRIKSMIGRYNDIAVSKNKNYYLDVDGNGNNNFSYYFRGYR